MTSTLEAPTAADAAGEIPVRNRRRIGGLNRPSRRAWRSVGRHSDHVFVEHHRQRMGNQFYAGAAQAGSKNWEALLFGSVDPDNFITVDNHRCRSG